MANEVEESRLLLVREIEAKDAAQFLELNRQIDLETTNMLLEPQERKTTLEEQESIIDRFQNSKNNVIFVAVSDGEIVGFSVARGGDFIRNRQTASVVIGVRRSWWGQGVGASLIDSLNHWAGKNCMHRLELTVRADNSRAISLYKRKGFVTEGRRIGSLFVDDKYVDEYYMAMLMGPKN